MSINKSIFYQLCNKGIMVNLYKLLFLSFHFSFQPNKRVFHPPTFSSLQTHEGKLNIFHPPTFPSSHNFPSFHFSTPPTKRTLRSYQLPLFWPINIHASLAFVVPSVMGRHLPTQGKGSFTNLEFPSKMTDQVGFWVFFFLVTTIH